ncbi:hypothetical protein BGW80DRAFT_1308238 [Lactifluus volemus]|nr:hypothetical protein BGW80DRAFT_1308238 [Lactifluus volemus]
MAIVHDVPRYVPLYWSATELAALTLKVDKDSLEDYTESRLYEMIADINSYAFYLLHSSVQLLTCTYLLIPRRRPIPGGEL